MQDPLHIAVDLGAGSGRVFIGGVSPTELLLEEVHRFQYTPSNGNGHLRWDAAQIFRDMTTGLREASKGARHLGRAVSSVGVDSWGTDYGLIDSRGELCENPICYRDKRTQATIEKVFGLVSREEIFNRTGIQFLVFNTLFQLHAHLESGIPGNASRLLLIPDLIHFLLTGKAATEYTNATTTQMVNARTGAFDSLALRYASVLNSIQLLAGRKIRGVHIVGGGSKNDYLNQATANATGLPVVAGPAEATVTVNVLVQAIASGRFSSLAEARGYMAGKVRLKKFMPRRTPALEEISRRYAAIEARWIEEGVALYIRPNPL